MPTPPGHGGLDDRLARLERRIEEESRRSHSGPVCVVRLGTPFPTTASTDHVLGTQWKATPEHDPLGMWHYSTDPAAPSYVLLPNAGRWSVQFHQQWAYGSAEVGLTAKLLLNGTSVANNAVGTSAVRGLNIPSEGTTVDLWVQDRVFAAGDTLRFLVWTTVSKTLLAQVNGVATHFVVCYLGPR